MKFLKILGLLLLSLVSFLLGFTSKIKDDNNEIVKKIIPEKSLAKYEIENLTSDNIIPGNIVILDKLSEHDKFDSYKFEFTFNPAVNTKETKKTSGMINLPHEGKLPIVIMIRGYVDPSVYQTGTGTKNASYYFAENSFITIAPDFLGYAQSDKESSDIFEARFQTYVTAISLIKSLDQIAAWDGKHIFIWGHSNGGQIALVILETFEKNIPTTLWAPVTKPFPYSILYYTDESEDRGKFIRNKLSDFENLYDVEKYSPDKYYGKITSPLNVHQGLNDDAVPFEWTRNFVKKLKELKKDVSLHEYSQADHNMRPNWDEAIYSDLLFFQKFLISPEN